MSYDGSVDKMLEDGPILTLLPLLPPRLLLPWKKKRKRRKKVNWDNSVLAEIIHPNLRRPLVRPGVNK
jgi:hypothetical protein